MYHHENNYNCSHNVLFSLCSVQIREMFFFFRMAGEALRSCHIFRRGHTYEVRLRCLATRNAARELCLNLGWNELINKRVPLGLTSTRRRHGPALVGARQQQRDELYSQKKQRVSNEICRTEIFFFTLQNAACVHTVACARTWPQLVHFNFVSHFGDSLYDKTRAAGFILCSGRRKWKLQGSKGFEKKRERERSLNVLFKARKFSEIIFFNQL